MSIKTGNLEAIAYHLEQGCDNGDVTWEALALFLRGVAVEMERLTAESHRLTERVAELEAENTAFLSFVIARINAIVGAGGDHDDMINDLYRLKNYLEGEAE